MVELLTGIWPPDPEKPREKPEEDLVEAAASCVSLCQRLTTSFAMGRRWYEETRAADETEGFLSTIAVFITRSMDWTVVAWSTPHQHLSPRKGNGQTRHYIDNAAQSPDGIGSEDSVGATAGILHDGAGDHDDVLGGVGQLLDHQVHHLPQAGILILEEL